MIKHLYKVHWDRRSPIATDAWIRKRLAFFREFTLPTIANSQVWMHCDPGMEEVMEPRIEGAIYTFLPYGNRPSLTCDSDHVYVTRIDSDDLYAPDALEHILATVPRKTDRVEAAVFRRGYTHELKTGRTGAFFNPSSPFHTLMFPRSVWEHDYAANFVGDHSKVGSRYICHVLPDWKFCVLVHGDNFITDFEYSRTADRVPKGFSLSQFLSPPVVFDVDDQCDEWDGLPQLDKLREHYPNFRCTLFTVPKRTSGGMMEKLKRRPWIEVAAHGITHEPTEELKVVRHRMLQLAMKGLDPHYVKGFRPPGWYMSQAGVDVCNELGMWAAIHVRDVSRLGSALRHGYYACGERFPYWHGHTHDVCGNGLEQSLPELLAKWPVEQKFAPVSEAVLCS